MNKDNERLAVLDCIAERARNLTDAYWFKILDIADTLNEKDETGVVKFSLVVELNFTGKTPAGTVNISIPPRTIKDGSSFRVSDPDEPELKI